jgi:LysR family transcriptional regulator for metE and metH
VRTPACAPTRLRVVCECYTAYHWLPSALAHLRSNLPQLDLSLLVEHTADPIAALEAGDIDAALLTTARVPKGRFEERSLFSDEVVFIVSATHPLAARKTITRTDLREHTLLTSSNVPVRESQWFMTRVFGSARPRLRFERLPLTEAILDVARAGMGIAVLSEWIASAHLAKGDLLVKRLASGPLHRPWRLAWRHGIDAAALRLRSALAATVPHLRRTG